MLNKLLLAAGLSLAVSFAFGQASIIDSQPMSGRAKVSSSRDSAPAASSVQAQTGLYIQLQALQEEVQKLRGLVEQQAYELKRIKQQRLDDYLDLDRRIGRQASEAKGKSILSSLPAINDRATAAAASPAGLFKAGEFASYQAAIGLALKKRDFDGAIAALHSHLKAYPKGNYVANAQYWLGQIYLQADDLALSKKWFMRMTQEYPSHGKAQEAKFKLGKVLHKLGENSKAKPLLQAVSNSGSSPASSLARDYLKQYF